MIMSEEKFSEFETLMLRSGSDIATSIFLILAWISASDGSIDEDEINAISEIAQEAEYSGDINALVKLAKKRDIVAIQLASEILKAQLKEKKEIALFLLMCIRIAVADGRLLASENHILKFLADLLELTKMEFEHLFKEATGRRIPHPQDLSDADYWKAHDNARHGYRAENKSNRSSKYSRYYAILGLEDGAAKEDIKMAYRRLAQVHHPDRFASLGKEAMAASTKNFQKIKEAYEYLMKHA